ncbi:cytosolic Fe-S cluster assembly factor narfl-like isoform X2 [Symsagittifera roscoffensis]|uniref:cytosolic Fe-S cluster assembly factor narfl-like isoform X2 n=1 Tax=Symsagittifera roscoffensis TaxID=84072 RepID=UPI00307BEE78
MFSVGVKISGLDDFIAPSQDCIKPAVVENRIVTGAKRGTIKVESDGTYKELSSNGDEVLLQKAKITLNDCLACSGTRKTGSVFAATVSPQSVASLAAFYSDDFISTAERISFYLKSIGVDYVFDSNIGRNLTLLESGKEFVERFRGKSEHFPVFTSSCPGWICYAEKTHGDFILPFISKVKSPQQMMGSLIKRQLASSLKVDADLVYHFTVMPCFDKKLEALRSDFVVPGTEIKEVDCVVATNELFLMMAESSQSFTTFEKKPFDSLVDLLEGRLNREYTFRSHEGSGAGGYIEHVFKYAADQLFGVKNPPLDFVVKRSTDHKELFLNIDGEIKLRFAVAYGFKNLGNFAMKLKKNNLKYDYVEIMACPSGCLNGGGQLRSEAANNKELLNEVTARYWSLPTMEPSFDVDLSNEKSECADDVNSFFFAEYKSVPKMNTNSLNIKW